MATWPHEETPLTEIEKNAYRYLLYRAFIDIRDLCQSRGAPTWNPVEWRRQYVRSREAGALADWLHNLADYAARDFAGFDPDWFWVEYDGLSRRLNKALPDRTLDYRRRYDNRIAGRNEW